MTAQNQGCSVQPMKYYERLAIARKHARLTQTQLAEKLGVAKNGKPIMTQANISKLETNPRINGSIHTLKLAKICGVSPDWLAYEEGEMMDNIYVPDVKLKQLLMIAQGLPEYGKDKAIKEVAGIAELIAHASNAVTKK